jgi:hypothetical protein
MGVPSHWVRFLRAWLADRRARRSLEREHQREQGLLGWSSARQPAESPAVYSLATADFPETVRTASPTCELTVYADDATLRCSSPILAEAGAAMQGALDAAQAWADKKYVKIAPQKTVAMICTLDPAEGNNKSSAPRLSVGGHVVKYDRPSILGVTFDPQIRFGQQALAATIDKPGEHHAGVGRNVLGGAAEYPSDALRVLRSTCGDVRCRRLVPFPRPDEPC